MLSCFASANSYSAEVQAIQRLCETDRNMCVLYFSALSDGLRAVEIFADVNQHWKPYCIPDDVSPEALAHVIVNYIDATPEEWHFGTTLIGYRALQSAFPCRP